MSSGYDNIDVEEIKKRGIKFGNTPGVLNDAVADMAVLLTLMTSRRYMEGREAIERCTKREFFSQYNIKHKNSSQLKFSVMRITLFWNTFGSIAGEALNYLFP